MIKELRPVLGVGGGAEDVHHHEVLDVVLLPPWLLQLVNIVPKYDWRWVASKLRENAIWYIVLRERLWQGWWYNKPANPLHLSDHGQVHCNLLLVAWHLPVNRTEKNFFFPKYSSLFYFQRKEFEWWWSTWGLKGGGGTDLIKASATTFCKTLPKVYKVRKSTKTKFCKTFHNI